MVIDVRGIIHGGKIRKVKTSTLDGERVGDKLYSRSVGEMSG